MLKQYLYIFTQGALPDEKAFFALFALVSFIIPIILDDSFIIELSKLFPLFNIPSFLFVFGLTVSVIFVTYPITDVLKAYKVSFSTLNKEHVLKAAELNEAELILELIRRLSIAAGVLGLLVGTVQLLASIESPSDIGPAMSLAYLPVIYGLVFAELLTHPLIKSIQFKRAQGKA